MKNKGVLILAPLLVLALCGISFIGGPVSYIFLLTIVLIPVVCYLYIFAVIQTLRIYQKTDGRDMVCKTPSDFFITLKNEGWFSFSYLRIKFYSTFSEISGIDDGTVYELLPHGSVLQTTKLMCRFRGEYKVGIKQIEVRDFLDLFSYIYTIKEPLSVIVSPAISECDIAEDELLPDADRDNLHKKPVPDIPVREYAPGDDVRFINWKKSAVMQKLMVRQRRGEENSGVALIMDPGRYFEEDFDFLPAENAVMEQVIGLALRFAKNSIPAEAIIRGMDTERFAITNMGEFEELYMRLRKYSFRDDMTMDTFLEELFGAGILYGFGMVILCVSSVTDETAMWARRIASEQIPMRVYCNGTEVAYDQLIV